MTFWYWDRLCVLCWRDCSTIDCGSDVLQKFYCSEPNIHDVCLSGSPVEVHSTFPLTWIIGCGDCLKPGLSSEELSLGAPVWCWGNNMGYAQFGCLSQHSITVLCPSAPLKSVPFKNQRRRQLCNLQCYQHSPEAYHSYSAVAFFLLHVPSLAGFFHCSMRLKYVCGTQWVLGHKINQRLERTLHL